MRCAARPGGTAAVVVESAAAAAAAIVFAVSVTTGELDSQALAKEGRTILHIIVVSHSSTRVSGRGDGEHTEC